MSEAVTQEALGSGVMDSSVQALSLGRSEVRVLIRMRCDVD